MSNQRPFSRTKRSQNLRRSKRSRLLRFESLEDRRLLAFNIVDDNLVIEGSAGDDIYHVRFDSAKSLLTVEENGSVYGFNPARFDTITINAGHGDDSIVFDVSGELLRRRYGIEVDGGLGANQIQLYSKFVLDTGVEVGKEFDSATLTIGHAGNRLRMEVANIDEIADTTRGDIFITGTSEDNSIVLDSGVVIDQSPTIRFANKSSFELEGGGGKDRFQVIPSNLSPLKGSVLGDENDAVWVSNEGLTTLTIDQNDDVFVELHTTDIRLSRFGELTVFGVGANDQLSFVGGNASRRLDDDLQLKPLGNGDASVRWNGAGRINVQQMENVALDMGGGDDRVDVLGTPLRDVVSVNPGEVLVNQQRIQIANHERLRLDLDDGDDEAKVVGDAKVAFEIHAGGASNGDLLTYSAKADVALQLAGHLDAAYQISEGKLKPVHFSGFEDVGIDANYNELNVQGTDLNDLIEVRAQKTTIPGTDAAFPQVTVFHQEGFATRFTTVAANELSFQLQVGEDHLRLFTGDGNDRVTVKTGPKSTIAVDGKLDLVVEGTEVISIDTGEGIADVTVHADQREPSTLNLFGSGPTRADLNLHGRGFVANSGEFGNAASMTVNSLQVNYANFRRVDLFKAADVETAFVVVEATRGNDHIYAGAQKTASAVGAGVAMVTVNEQTPIFMAPAEDFDSIRVSGLAGNDQFTVDPYVMGKFSIEGGRGDADDIVTIVAAQDLKIEQLGVETLTVTGFDQYPIQLFEFEDYQIHGFGVSGVKTKLQFSTPEGEQEVRFHSHLEPGSHRLQVDDWTPLTLKKFTEGSSFTLKNSGDKPREDRLRYIGPNDDNTFLLDANSIDLESRHLSATPDLILPGIADVRLQGGRLNDRFSLREKMTPRLTVDGGDAEVVNTFVDQSGSEFAAYQDLPSELLLENANLKNMSKVIVDTQKLLIQWSDVGNAYATIQPETGSSGKLWLEHRPELIEYLNTSSLHVNAMNGAGHRLRVLGSHESERITASAGAITVGPASFTYGLGIKAIEIDAREGADTVEVTPGPRPIFVDGGNPIGFGDKLIVKGPSTFYPGPENDEGGFDTPGKAPVSYDHIESATIEKELQFDWGDLNTFDTAEADNGPRHAIRDGFHLGELVDAEPDALLTTSVLADASGDDSLDQSDDEDGVVFGLLSIGQQGSAEVFASQDGRLDAWIDFDQNQKFELHEHLNNGASFQLSAGANTIRFPVSATQAGRFGARFRFHDSTAGPLGPVGVLPDGTAPNGEVEDYIVEIEELDFGDAPDSYGTLLASQGARHALASFDSPRLGANVESSIDGHPSVDADGDDLENIDDEDGVTIPQSVFIGQGNTITVEVQGPVSSVRGWMDFDRNGRFDANEIIIDQRFNGVRPFNVQVPSEIEPGPTYARFRVTTATEALGPTGVFSSGRIPNGEVEDYLIQLQPGECGLGFCGDESNESDAPIEREDLAQPPMLQPVAGLGEAATFGVDANAAPATPRQNQDNPFDVDRDGQVTLLDAQIVINQVNQHHNLSTPLGGDGPAWSTYDCDVNGDGVITEADVYPTIDVLREQFLRRGVQAEGEVSERVNATIADLVAPTYSPSRLSSPVEVKRTRHVEGSKLVGADPADEIPATFGVDSGERTTDAYPWAELDNASDIDRVFASLVDEEDLLSIPELS